MMLNQFLPSIHFILFFFNPKILIIQIHQGVLFNNRLKDISKFHIDTFFEKLGTINNKDNDGLMLQLL